MGSRNTHFCERLSRDVSTTCDKDLLTVEAASRALMPEAGVEWFLEEGTVDVYEAGE